MVLSRRIIARICPRHFPNLFGPHGLRIIFTLIACDNHLFFSISCPADSSRKMTSAGSVRPKSAVESIPKSRSSARRISTAFEEDGGHETSSWPYHSLTYLAIDFQGAEAFCGE